MPAFLGASIVGLLTVWALAEMLAPGVGLPIMAPICLFATITVFAGWGLHAHYPHRRLGACNLVTMVRAALISVLAMPVLVPDPLMGGASAWGFFAVAFVAFLLDGVDGWLARRSGLLSLFGARFDMEVDAVFAALLSLIALSGGHAGWWVLGLGFMRYGFVAAGWTLPWLRGALPERFRRKVVCVIQVGALIALLAPVVQPPGSAALAAVALAVLLWSFALDVIWLWRRRWDRE